MGYTSPEVEERVMEDIVDRLRVLNFMGPWKEAADEIEKLRNAITVQANAVRVLHEAEMSELNRLRKNAQEAYTAKATLDSEREANKILTDEIEKLREALKKICHVTGSDMEAYDIAENALKEKE